MKKVFLVAVSVLLMQMTQAISGLSIEDVINQVKKYETGSASGSYYLLDSIFRNNASNVCLEKYVYEFDVKNTVVDLSEYYSKKGAEANSSLMPVTWNKYSCDLLNKKITNVEYTWENGKWVNFSKVEYTLDQKLQIVLRTCWSWNVTSSSWVPGYKAEYAFDEAGETTLEAYYSWDSVTNKWIGDEDDGKQESIHTSTGWVNIDSEWDDEKDDWEYSNKFEINETTSGNATLSTGNYSYWNSSNKTWIEINKSKTENVLVENKKTSTSYQWDTGVNDWIKDSKYEIISDSIPGGTHEMHLSYDWSATDTTWLLLSKYEYTLDTNKNFTSIVFYKLDEKSQEWRKDSKTAYTFDIKNNKTSETHYSFYSNSLDNKDSLSIQTKKVWIFDDQGNLTRCEDYGRECDWEFGSYVWYFRLLFYEEYAYSHIVLSSVYSTMNKKEYSIFPNPVSNDFRIQGTTDGTLVQFLDLNGRIITSTMIRGKNPISTGNLPKGLYLVKVSSPEGSVILKMEKK